MSLLLTQKDLNGWLGYDYELFQLHGKDPQMQQPTATKRTVAILRLYSQNLCAQLKHTLCKFIL